jgi:type I restriction enzyme S subunit
MREGWRKQTLDEVAEIQYGTRVVQSRDGGTIYPVYGGGGATFKMNSYNRESCLVVSRFAMSPQCTRFVNGKFFLNDSGLTLKSLDTRSLSQTFLERFILGHNDDIYMMGKGMAQKNLDMKSFKNLIILFPNSIQEQLQIVNELDLLSGIIEKQKAQLNDLDALTQSIFYEMFGDVNNTSFSVKTLNDVCEFIKDGTHQTPTYTEDTINGVKFLSAKDVVSGYINWTNIKFIPFDLHTELYKRISPKRGDILLCKNGTTGICAIVDTDDVFDIYVSLALLRPKTSCLPEYLHYAINNPYTKRQFDGSLKGIGVPNLHLGEIKKAKIILPPLSLQHQFAERIESIERMKQQVQTAIKDLETLLASRMQYWFD